MASVSVNPVHGHFAAAQVLLIRKAFGVDGLRKRANQQATRRALWLCVLLPRA